MLFEKWSGSNNRLTRHSCSGKHSRLGGHSLRSIHFIWFLITWVMVGNTSKCVFVLISMLGWVKDSHYSSCFVIQFIKAGPLNNPPHCKPTHPTSFHSKGKSRVQSRVQSRVRRRFDTEIVTSFYKSIFWKTAVFRLCTTTTRGNAILFT